MTIQIYHPVGGILNHDLRRGHYEYEFITSMTCDSLGQAFKMGQNDFNSEYAKLDKRSTSVGDIFIVDEKTHYFVGNRGFIEIPGTVTRYIDYSTQEQ